MTKAKNMKIALVHDYINEFGGAERTLKVLSEMYPKAPIYTAFRVKQSTADRELKGKDIRESWLAPLLKIWKLYSPLRFLIPLIWGSFDLSKYDLVITSCSWYVARGFKVGPKTLNIAYCHTPPRWLYGYQTSVGFTKYWPVKIYSAIVGHFIRMYDFRTAQKVDFFVANSKEVQARIEKFYRKAAKVIYPPVDTTAIGKTSGKKEDYFLIASRLVGAKGIEEAINAFRSKELSKYKLKIVGEPHGFSDVESKIKNQKSNNVEILGRVPDKNLWDLYAKARGLLVLAREEDFGMTPVEAMASGTPILAFYGGGYKESIVDGKTGIFIHDTDEKSIKEGIKKLVSTKWDRKVLQKQAQRFSKEKFKENFSKFVKESI